MASVLLGPNNLLPFLRDGQASPVPLDEVLFEVFRSCRLKLCCQDFMDTFLSPGIVVSQSAFGT